MIRNKVVGQILTEYWTSRQEYYRKKIHDKQPLKDIIQETVNLREFPILAHLVLHEFPEYKDKVLKYLLIQ